MSNNRWTDKEDVVHTYTMYSAVKKDGNNAICSNMDGSGDDHTKWKKSAKERQILYDVTYMWSPKHDTNELIYQIETDSQTYRTDLWLPREMESGRWIRGLGLAEANYYIKWIKNKALLFSIGNYSQYPMEMKMEKKKKKNNSQVLKMGWGAS